MTKSKLRTYQFRLHGKRRTLRLGRLNRDQFNAVKAKVVALIESKIKGVEVGADTAQWVADRWREDPALANKLVQFGVINPPVGRIAGNMPTVRAFVDGYIAGRKDVAKRSLSNAQQAADALVRFVGDKCLMSDVNLGTVKDFKAGLHDDGYAEATASRWIRYCREFWQDAIDRDIIAKNPFSGIKVGSESNDARKYHVSREEAQALIDAAPDAEWRLLIALSRYAGLRVPSEALALRWSDINWERGRMTIRSPKTARHKDKAQRIIPIFPEVLSYLEDAFELAKDKTDRVISRYPEGTANLREKLYRIFRQAGIKPWQRCWHNMRASCEKELAAKFPLHVAAAWAGNSERVASKHYLTVRESDFEAARNPMPNALPSSTIRQGSGTITLIEDEEPNSVEPSRNAVLSGRNRDMTDARNYSSRAY